MKVSYMLAGAIVLMSAPALADSPECHVRILNTLTDDVGNTWQPRKILPVDIQRVDAKGVSFCAHGGSCIPRMSGTSVSATLIDCRKGNALGGGDYALVRSHHRPSAIRTGRRSAS